jgi:hypothetical protein
LSSLEKFTQKRAKLGTHSHLEGGGRRIRSHRKFWIRSLNQWVGEPEKMVIDTKIRPFLKKRERCQVG